MMDTLTYGDLGTDEAGKAMRLAERCSICGKSEEEIQSGKRIEEALYTTPKPTLLLETCE